MIRNYLKIAFRSLRKQKVYSSINIMGLSVGIASCLLIIMFVLNEFSYDSFHAKADNIYKIALERKYPNHSTNYAIIPHSYGDVIQQDFAEVESVVKMGGPFNNVVVNYKNEKDELIQFEENFLMAADSNFFNVFSIKLQKGDPKKVLVTVNDIVITENTALRYFGKEDPIGKVLRFFNQDFKVTGVCENVPENSHMKFDFLGKWDDEFFGGRENNFITFSAHMYVVLKPGTDPKQLEAKFPKMVDTYASAQIEADLGKSWEDYKKEGNGYRYFLQPLSSIHLDPLNIEAKIRAGGNISYVYFLICVAGLIVVIACINFMNLATARSAERAREVGLRKTMGSIKQQLVAQFLVESTLLSFLATCLAVLFVQLGLPFFNDLAQKNLTLIFSIELIGGLLILSILVGTLAGSYPAFFLSAFNPVVVMKGNFTGNTKGAWLRNGLVVFQFWISIILIVGTLVVSRQMKFMQDKSLGYDKEQLLVVERVFALQNKSQTFLDELSSLPEVRQAAGAFSMLGRQGDFFGAQFIPEGSSEILTTKSMGIDDVFAETIGFTFLEGKGYSKETNDSLSIILNETAVKTLGLTNPVGQKLNQVQRRQDGNVTVPYTIIGVIKDFNFQSLRDPITPLTIQSTESFGGGVGYAYVKIKAGEIPSALSKIEAKWKELIADQPFKFTFLDQELQSNYESEKRAGTLFGVFSGLAILIACIGLFGLAAYTASLRTKEIGVRKVLGASVSSVIILLSRDFTKLIAIAFILAVPLSWYIMKNWLDGFAYRTDLSFDVFIIAGSISILIAWITVSYQSIKAAVANPVKSLRSE
ncbi:MAG: ABC transporter permease [Flammeovirgaceae bacterium]|nr:ABC transporter permease [Flammeovirgaceae bacterium]